MRKSSILAEYIGKFFLIIKSKSILSVDFSPLLSSLHREKYLFKITKLFGNA